MAYYVYVFDGTCIDIASEFDGQWPLLKLIRALAVNVGL